MVRAQGLLLAGCAAGIAIRARLGILACDNVMAGSAHGVMRDGPTRHVLLPSGPEGRYVTTAEVGQSRGEQVFDVRAGGSREVEVQVHAGPTARGWFAGK